jgi:hypothetical protein
MGPETIGPDVTVSRELNSRRVYCDPLKAYCLLFTVGLSANVDRRGNPQTERVVDQSQHCWRVRLVQVALHPEVFHRPGCVGPAATESRMRVFLPSVSLSGLTDHLLPVIGLFSTVTMLVLFLFRCMGEVVEAYHEFRARVADSQKRFEERARPEQFRRSAP